MLMTKKMQEQLDNLRSAADSGHLGARISRFLRRSVREIELVAEVAFSSRAELQEHIDTLRELIDVWVHYGRG